MRSSTGEHSDRSAVRDDHTELVRALDGRVRHLREQVELLGGLREDLSHRLEVARLTLHSGANGVRSGVSGVPSATPGASRGFSPPFRLAHLQVIPDRHAVVNGVMVHELSRTEWLLFRFFAEHPGRTLTRRELAAGAWGPGYGGRSNQVEVYVSRLRAKLESPDPSAPRLMRTVRGRGYTFLAGTGADSRFRHALDGIPADGRFRRSSDGRRSVSHAPTGGRGIRPTRWT